MFKKDCSLKKCGIIFIGIAVPLALAVSLLFFKSEVYWVMIHFSDWFKLNPYKGFFAFSFTYYLWVPTTLPSTLMTLFGGFIFSHHYGKLAGYGICMLAIWMSHPLAALLTFTMARCCLKSFIRRTIIDKIRVFKAVDKSFESQGLKLMILLRV